MYIVGGGGDLVGGTLNKYYDDVWEYDFTYSCCVGDFDDDGDVDSVDLVTQAKDGTGISSAEFANHYGRDDCSK